MVEQIIEPEDVAEAPDDWRLIGADVSEQLDYERARFFRRRLVRCKYAKRNNAYTAPVIAALPPSLQGRCLATPGLISAVIVGKYGYHLSLYGQEAISVICHWVHPPRIVGGG